jgi:hypothetical protein
VLTDSLLREPPADSSSTGSRPSVLRDTSGSADAITGHTSRLSIGRRESIAEGGTHSVGRGSSTENGYGSGGTGRYGSAAGDSGYSSSRRLSRALSSYDTEGKYMYISWFICAHPRYIAILVLITARIRSDFLGTAQYFYKFSTYSSLFLQLNIPTGHFLYVFCLYLEFFCWLVLGTILSLI